MFIIICITAFYGDLEEESKSDEKYLLRTHNQLVAGSSPAGPTENQPLNRFACKWLLFF
jgi:hypothetical protein